MRKLFSIVFVCGIFIGGMNSTSAAQDNQKKFFHDLKGIEDSTGTTHLFYRLYDHRDEDYDVGSESCIIWRNDVFHFNTQAGTDSLKFESLRQHRCLMFDNPIMATEDYAFVRNDPNKWFTMNFTYGIYQNYFGTIRSYNGSFYDALGHLGKKLEVFQTDSNTIGIYGFSSSSIVNVLDGDSLPSETYPRVLLVKSQNDPDEYEKVCPNGENNGCFYGESDSLFIHGLSYLAIDQYRKPNIYFQRNDSLFKSETLGRSLDFLNHDFTWSSMGSFIFSSEDSTIIATTRFKYSPLEGYFEEVFNKKNKVKRYQLLKSVDMGYSWEEVRVDSNKIYPSQILEDGVFYFGNNRIIYKTENNGKSISEFLNLNHSVTGLYKKPDSDILYVLTKEELLEVNTETKETTSLKKLPVSNESEPSEIPNQITLKQNYPNPFNPSTVISYQLTENSLVRLEVFDVTGRKVAVLVDGERKSAGQYQVTFDASGLSSGVYFYRLEASGETLLRRMMFIK